MKVHLFTLLVVTILANSICKGNDVVLTNINGTGIECEILKVKKNWIRILKSEREYSIKLDQLNLASQEVAENWAKNNAISAGDLYITIVGPERRTYDLMNENLVIQQGSSERVYKINLRNSSEFDIDGIDIEYKVYWLDGRVDLSDPFYFWKDCHIKVGDINSGESKILTSEYITIKRREDRRDSLIGIYVRIYRNAKLLREVFEPSGLLDKVKWQNFSIDAIQ